MTGIFFIISFVLHFFVIKCDDLVKSSLTFVIDDTGSMSDDIRQVKESANAIFDTVMENKNSPIENFILVTFNDPDVRPPTITQDRDTFKQALNRINVNGGGDCPEYAMSGIESALNVSLPRSFVYVFTDASAKDYHKYEIVKSLAQKKSSQVVFVLTKRCNYGSERRPDEQAYYDLADATSGQVFNLEKHEVRDILDYVVDSIKGLSTVLTKTKLPPGYGHKINITADDHIKDVVISATGDEPKIEDITDPEGGKPDTIKIVEGHKIAIVKVPESKVGVYTAQVGSKSDTDVVATGKTTIDFQHGFSVFKPTSIKDTATRPQRDVDSYLLIKLNIIEGGEVKLTHVKIMDDKKNVMLEEPLKVLNDEERLYITNPFKIPNHMIQIMVIGYTVANNKTITRLSPTMIEPQNPELEIKEPRSPKISIDGGPKVSAGYNEPLKLSCRVNAYPKPDVIWIEESSGLLLPSTVVAVELPYEYIGIIEIEKVNKDSRYTCKASNAHGEDTKSVAVEIPTYFIVMESPKNATIKYHSAGVFLCKINAFPPAKIIWYRNGNELAADEYILISADGSTLTIPKMEPRLQGYYTCDASNGIRNESLTFKVAISGVEPPRIDKLINSIHVAKGSDPELVCRVSEVLPPPRFKWYFKKSLAGRFRRVGGIYSNKIKFKNITSVKAGVYKCMAFNDIGHDVHDTELVVEYPPIVKENKKFMSGNVGDQLTLTCEVDGVPTPIVTWTKDDILVHNMPRTPIYRDNSLKLKLAIEDSGTYKCTASNRLGKAMKEINVEVYVPAIIQPPRESPVNLKVGDDIKLLCDADGVPKPEIKWVFHDEKMLTESIMDTDSTNLLLSRAQLKNAGYYTCIARNTGGSFNITYEVRVHAPPNIENMYKDKTFRPVEGDMVLAIKCNATGSPKPAVTWTKDGMIVASGTPWYHIDEFGTLYIKNIDDKSTGTYVCRADNILGRDTELFYVAADPYPRDASPTSTLLIEQGSSTRVECNVPHSLVDSIRWYKDRTLLTPNELAIYDAKLSDSGLYVCRVSDLMKSNSGYTKVTVGFKPRFATEEEENIELAEGYFAELICTNDAEPPAKIHWWHNGIMLNETSPEYLFYMKTSDHGNYTCEASNEFGKIQRTFFMRSRDCLISVRDDFTETQPIMITSPLNWPSYEIVDGHMVIPRDEYVSLLCPDSFTTFPSQYATAFCSGENNFIIKGITYKFSELKCKSKIEPDVYTTGDECFGDGTEMLKINFKVFDSFLEAYEVCYNKNKKIPIYTKQQLDRHVADVEPEDAKWLSTDLWPLDSVSLYECNNQVRKISLDLAKWFHASDRCCFNKRQLINPRDMAPGLKQYSTYSYLNVVPHWSTCNTNNWDDLEQRIRNLVKSVDYPFSVWTGTYRHLQLPSSGGYYKYINIDDAKGMSQHVPHYLWKVIQDPVTSSSLAIVQINVPDLESSEAIKHVRCGDICDDIPWLSGTQWHNVSRGYIYCCDLKDFVRAFGFKDTFNREYGAVLDRVSFLPKHSLA